MVFKGLIRIRIDNVGSMNEDKSSYRKAVLHIHIHYSGIILTNLFFWKLDEST